jgi:hypothetical protein
MVILKVLQGKTALAASLIWKTNIDDTADLNKSLKLQSLPICLNMHEQSELLSVYIE